MSISFVQSRSTSITSTSGTLAFNSDNTAGNTIIIAAVSDQGSDTLTISDNNGNTYTSLTSVTASGVTIRLFYAFGINAGANTVTLTSSTSVNLGLTIHEFSGINTIDQTSGNSGTGNSQTSNSASTTTVADELLFGFTGMPMSTGTVQTMTGETGWTTAEVHASSVTEAYLSQYKIVSATGSYAATTTTTVSKGGSGHWGAEIATFYSATNASFPVTGLSSTTALGTTTKTGDAETDLAGISSTVSLGTVSPDVSTPVTGLSATSSIGTTTETGDANFSVAGIAATGTLGTTIETADSQISIAGLSSTISVGSTTENVSTGIAGISSTTSLGMALGSGTATISITGVSSTFSLGTVSERVDVGESITGVSCQVLLGTVIPICWSRTPIVVFME